MKQIFLMGPTASGKTEIATRLFQELKLQLVSVDATQIYCDCNIGSAKLPVDELKKYPHEVVNYTRRKSHPEFFWNQFSPGRYGESRELDRIREWTLVRLYELAHIKL